MRAPARARMHARTPVCIRVYTYNIHCGTHLVVLHDGSGLSLGGHIQFAGVPSLLPLRAEREISASAVSIRPSVPVSSSVFSLCRHRSPVSVFLSY